MLVTSGLPYAPHRYDYDSRVVTTLATPTFLVPADTTRIYLSVEQIGLVAGLNTSIGFGGNGDGNVQYLYNGTNLVEFWWYKHFTIMQSSVYIIGFAAGTVFRVNEVFYNQLTDEEMTNVTRKPESLANKIKNFIRYK